jgi:hypothetical protein
MRLFARSIVAVGAIICVLPVTASGQRSADLRAGMGGRLHSESSVQAGVHFGEAKRSSQGSAVGMANGALVGAGIGAALGLVAAPIVNAQNSDHTEDAMTYVLLPTFGAFLGLIIGGIVGWTRAP